MNTPGDPGRICDLPTIGIDAPVAVHPAVVPTGAPFGDYILNGEIGRGGMGVVYKAYEPELKRYVAIKMILTGQLSDAADIQRFHTEAAAAACLQHPNIVKVHRVGVLDNKHYYAMAFINGPSLTQKLAGGPLPGRIAARYMVTIAQAIQHAHDQGILHRDLKPSNILIDERDEPNVTDFGLAKHLSEDSTNTRTGTLIGTPSYMAPEQAQSTKELTPATDVYGLGALLYELLTARPPFRGESPFDTVMQVLENEPVPPRLLNPRVDHDLETICLKCLCKQPRDRCHSARELAEDLERFLAGEPIQARSLNLLDYFGRTLERSHFDVEFRQFGNAILWFAGIVGGMHAIKQWALFTERSPGFIVGLHLVQFLLMLIVVWTYRKTGLLPSTKSERLLWILWSGYIVSCVVISNLVGILFGTEALYEGKVYPIFCAVTAYAFLVMGSSYWGMFYALAMAFFGLSLGLVYVPHWGPLCYGGLWMISLIIVGFRLRKLGQDRGSE